LVLDIAGVVFWAGTWMSLGYLSGRSPEFIVALTSRAGSLLAGLATGFMIYMLLKIVRRRGFPRHFRMSRITASKPKSLLDRGEDVWIPDLRPGPEAEESLGGAAVDDTPWPGRARRCDTRRPRADGSVLLVKALGGGWDVAARLKPE
jgi:hypothetical protein